MKNIIATTFKLIIADRAVAALMVGLVLLMALYVIYVGVSLRPSDLQIAVHYTAFGETTFYREKWYYLLSFIAFAVLVAIVHIVLAAKLYVEERRQLSIFFLWLSIFLLLIAWFLTHAVLGAAFPS